MIEKVNAVPIILPSTESMTVEFKSDRNGYPDHELIEALTCLANSQGGELWLGVEDNGSASGLHPRHQDTLQLTQLIADNTSPALQVTIKQHQINGVTALKDADIGMVKRFTYQRIFDFAPGGIRSMQNSSMAVATFTR